MNGWYRAVKLLYKVFRSAIEQVPLGLLSQRIRVIPAAPAGASHCRDQASGRRWR
ncbi:MAG TPA: hypothetical protein VLO12_03525 [Halomonas sp.]|nr:hypothetical protein [Halomonas sp.]